MFSKSSKQVVRAGAILLFLALLVIGGVKVTDQMAAASTKANISVSSSLKLDPDNEIVLKTSLKSLKKSVKREGEDDAAATPSPDVTAEPSATPSVTPMVTEHPTGTTDVRYLVSVEKGQILYLSRYVKVSGISASEKKLYKLKYQIMTQNTGTKKLTAYSDGRIKTKAAGTAYVKVTCEKSSTVVDTEIVAVRVLSKSSTVPRKKARALYSRISKLNSSYKITEKRIGGYYNKLYKVRKLVNAFAAYDEYNQVKHDGRRNYLGITNAWNYGDTKDNLESYLNKHKLKISRIKYISEYEGFQIVFNHKVLPSDVVSYAYKKNRSYSKNLKALAAVIVTNSSGKRLQGSFARIARGNRYVVVPMKSSSFQTGTYTISSGSFYRALAGKCRFYKVYHKSGKLYYMKKRVSIRSASRFGKTVQAGSLYRSYLCVQKGSNGWYRVRLNNGKVGYVRGKFLSTSQPAKYRAVSSSDSKYSYSDMASDIGKLKSRYGGILSVSILTQTADSNNIYCMRLGNANASKKIIIQSTMHAREWLNSQMIMQSVEYYCKNYYAGSYKGTTLKKLFNNVCFYIIPMLNPDGVNISQYGLSRIKSPTLKKLVKKIGQGNYSTWKANARGVDLNRNFSTGFNKKDSKKKPASEFYPGKKPLSEKETQALVNLINQVHPKAVVNYHEVGNVIYYTKQTALLNTVKKITGYTPTTDGEDSHGTLGDWLDAKNIAWVTPETCSGAAPVSHSQYGKLWKENKDIIAAIAKLYGD